MKKSLLALVALGGLSACGGAIYDVGPYSEPAFQNQGALECPPGTVSASGRLVGTPASPLRCGPQSQPIPGSVQA